MLIKQRPAIVFLLTLLWMTALNSLSPFQDGEKLVFDIRYGIIGAGQATLHIEEIDFRDGIRAYQITSEARTNRFFDRIFKVRDEIVSVMDKEKHYSHRFTKRLQEGRYRQHRIHFYYPEQNFSLYMRYSFSSNEWSEERIEIPSDTQDILSAFYWLRKQEFAPGDTVRINVTADGENYEAKVLVHGKETIKTIFGTKECLIIEPVLAGDAIFKQTGEITIWITNDEHKIPVKLESRVIFGSFTATLSEADNVPYR